MGIVQQDAVAEGQPTTQLITEPDLVLRHDILGTMLAQVTCCGVQHCCCEGTVSVLVRYEHTGNV
jgi:hypothetical protein